MAIAHPDQFTRRHIGPDAAQQQTMLKALGQPNLEALIEATVPAAIRRAPLDLPVPTHEHGALAELATLAGKNQVRRSLIGLGYHDTRTPPVIQRNILENPGWYTQYTPYQAEISQGRLEMLLTFQTLICDLTGLPIANASLLDESTACAEAMHLCLAVKDGKNKFLVSTGCHPQTIDVVKTRGEALGIEVVVTDEIVPDAATAGILLAYPASDGAVTDPRPLIEAAHAAGALAVITTDPLACCLLTPPGELGADVAVGSAQRLGVPLGFGGPHAAFFATKEEYKRSMPGRLVGVSKDRHGRPALRLALQTREQHIRREKATSNICTAQALLANMAAAYAVYHGPEGLRGIAARIHDLTSTLALGLQLSGFASNATWFDTITVNTGWKTQQIAHAATAAGYNLRVGDGTISISLDECSDEAEVAAVLALFGAHAPGAATSPVPEALRRTSAFCTHPVFNSHRSETEMLRYLKKLENRDLSLVHSMIPLGSCTMKLNATVEMYPVSWPGFSRLHPFAPSEQTLGWRQVFGDLERWLGEITGLPGVSLQPNAGSAGEYAGLLAIRAWHRARGDVNRTICLIPTSAHGTNPASAVMAGMTVVAVACDDKGNISVDDLKAKIAVHAANLSCLMVTYPSTHGVFEATIRDICAAVHEAGGQVYMDGANMNAQVGLTSPAAIGADVCHLNLHKTFCIPHGGGGPGMGPICVAAHLIPHLPGHSVISPNGHTGNAVSAAPWGSASILLISWVYIRLMGGVGLTDATRVAILNANYLAARLKPYYPILYSGTNGTVAHECIIDLRPFKPQVEAEDVAKRLIDYGFHSPTLSFPVAGTLMIEPTESESLAELDRFADALIAIHGEIEAVRSGKADAKDNVLKNAPHPQHEVTGDTWTHPYGRQQAAFPAAWTKDAKFWPTVARVDNVYGDRNLICSCVGMEAYRA